MTNSKLGIKNLPILSFQNDSKIMLPFSERSSSFFSNTILKYVREDFICKNMEIFKKFSKILNKF
jgi:hypothetical protein